MLSILQEDDIYHTAHLLVEDNLYARLCINLNNLGVTVSDSIYL